MLFKRFININLHAMYWEVTVSHFFFKLFFPYVNRYAILL